MSTIRIHKLPFHHFNVNEAAKMGLEKTIILYNISEVPNCPRNQKHLHFPYIDPEKFYQLLDEIVKEGLAWEEESNE